MGSGEKYISEEDLGRHNKAGDLWISIEGKVYDVSDWAAGGHPGGAAPLLHLAGRDVTDAFLAYHPASARLRLGKLFTGYRLRDYSVSDVSKDYRTLLSHFTDTGLFDKKGHCVFFTFCVMAVLLAASVYGVLWCGSSFISGVLMGLLWIQSGWIGHDSGHYQVMPTRGLNRAAQVVSGNLVAGISIGWWKWNHNAHHMAVNSLELDPDIQHMPFFAVSAKLFDSLTSCFYGRKMRFDRASRFLVSHQHLTFYPVMCLARLNLFAQSFLLLLSARKVPNRGQEVLGILAFWIWYPLLVSCLPGARHRAVFVLASFAVTGIQHVQFCLNHFSARVYLGSPGGNDWFQKQTSGTLNISCSPAMDWFHGGLQFQIEHHLFPRLPRGQLRTAAPFVKALCHKHTLQYDVASFYQANVMTLTTLKATALQARNLLWEAVNTIG